MLNVRSRKTEQLLPLETVNLLCIDPVPATLFVARRQLLSAKPLSSDARTKSAHNGKRRLKLPDSRPARKTCGVRPFIFRDICATASHHIEDDVWTNIVSPLACREKEDFEFGKNLGRTALLSDAETMRRWPEPSCAMRAS